jgi:hypothetical protein
MNSNGPYTICNLDNNTYVTHYSQESAAAASHHHHHAAAAAAHYGYAAAADYDQYAHAYGAGAGGGGGGTGGSGSAGCQGAMDLASPLAYGGEGSVITHTQQVPYMHCAQGQQPYHPYYGGLVNGDLTGHIPNSPGYPPAYPDSYSPGMMGQHPCSTPGYGGGSQPSSPDQGPVTTYKWMTVKRSQPKTNIDPICK